MKGKRFVLLLFLFLFFLPAPVFGGESEMLPDLSVLEDAILDLERSLERDFSLKDMYHSILNGDFSFDISLLLQGILSLVFDELRTFSSLLAQLLLLGVLSAVFGVFSANLDGTSAKVGQWVVYLAFLLVAVKNFHIALELGVNAIRQSADFLYAVLPILLSAFALTGGAVSSSVVQPGVVMVISLFLGLLERFFLPLLLVYAALMICSRLSSGYSFRKFAELLKSILLISLGFLMTVFIGVLSLSGFVAGTVDGLTMKTVKMAAGNFIPLVGGYIADAFDSILGAGMLLRSSIGVFGIIAVAVILISPGLHILLMAFLFRFAAAVLQVFSDDTVVTGLSDFSSVLTVLFALVAAAGLLFFFLIFCIVGVSSMTMMFR